MLGSGDMALTTSLKKLEEIQKSNFGLYPLPTTNKQP